MISAGPTYTVEWAAGTAAGRHLGSTKALFDQWIPRQALDHILCSSRSLVAFHTGGWPQPDVQAWILPIVTCWIVVLWFAVPASM